MGDKSNIQWTDATWNPTTGCDVVSPGCANCYAMAFAPRLKAFAIGRGQPPDAPYMRDGDPKTSGPGFGVMLHEQRLTIPLNWQRPRRIFVDSMSDLFHPEVPDEFLDRVFAVMALAPQHVFQVLTKRPERMREYIEYNNGGDSYDVETRQSRVLDAVDERLGMYANGANRRAIARDPRRAFRWPIPNVWLGTSVENARWRTRIDELRQTPAAVRFLSCEPLLGPLARCETCGGSKTAPNGIDVCLSCGGSGRGGLDLSGIDWVIVGGESGPNARPMSEAWVRGIVAECRRQGALPFVKQMGTIWAVDHGQGRSHGGDWDKGWPEDLRVREMPSFTAAVASLLTP